MKRLYLIGGAMGVGKTTVCNILNRMLDRAVFLDGDWCWNADPFQVTEETKALVVDNICHLLNNFIRCTAYENIIFCWVLHEQAIIDGILDRLDAGECELRAISLVCTPEALTARLRRDIDGGLRREDVIGRSLDRLRGYAALDTVKLDVSHITAREAAERIAAM